MDRTTIARRRSGPLVVPPVRGVLQRKCACGTHTGGGRCAHCEEEAEASLQRSAIGPRAGGAVPAIVRDVLGTPGRPLDHSTRAFMEPRFARDFSHVRVHTGPKAAASADAVNALAYTVGSHIVLGGRQGVAGREDGVHVLAHELAHVVQQDGLAATAPLRVDDSATAESEADRVASHVVNGRRFDVTSRVPRSLRRKVKVAQPKDPIPDPTGKGLKQSNAETVEQYLQTLCADGKVAVDRTTGDVSLTAADFCPKPMPPNTAGPPAPAPSDTSTTPTGCGCLCDMIGSANDFTIVVDDKEWPHTLGRTVTTPSPNSRKLWGGATVSGKMSPIDPWLVLGHELCGHAWLDEKGLPDNNATRGEGGHQETVERENLLRKEHGLEERGRFKDPYCGESFWRAKLPKGPGPIQWSRYLSICAAWRWKNYGRKYKISDRIP
jgi:hypothetical protein